MSVQLQCAPSRDAWSCNTIEKVHVVYDSMAVMCNCWLCCVVCTNRHSSLNKSPPLPCVQSKPLTHSLASGIYHWLLVHYPHLSGFWESHIPACPYLKLLYNL